MLICRYISFLRFEESRGFISLIRVFCSLSKKIILEMSNETVNLKEYNMSIQKYHIPNTSLLSHLFHSFQSNSVQYRKKYVYVHILCIHISAFAFESHMKISPFSHYEGIFSNKTISRNTK